MQNLPVQINLVNDEARVSTLIISENTNIKYESIRDLVNKYKEELLQFGNIPTADLKSVVGKESKKLAMLNEQQSTLLITFLKNTKEVIHFKTNLVKAFYLMKNTLSYPNQKFEQTLEALSQKSIEADNWKEKYLQGLERENQLLHEKINLSEHSVKKSSRLTIQEKAKIVKLHKQDYKVHEICEITNRSEAVVRKTIKLGVKDGK